MHISLHSHGISNLQHSTSEHRQNEIDFHLTELSIEDFRLNGMLMEVISHSYGNTCTYWVR